MAWMLGGLIVVAALSFLVGHFAAEGSAFLDWGLASLFGTALGTTALAGFTGALAYTTSGDVRATWRLAELTREDQAARERPVLVMESAEWTPDSDVFGHLIVSLRNVGLGPALRVVIETRYADESQPAQTAPGFLATLMPGDVAAFRLPARFASEPSGGVRRDYFPVRGVYFDRSQETEYEVITAWKSPPSMSWHDPMADSYTDLTGRE